MLVILALAFASGAERTCGDAQYGVEDFRSWVADADQALSDDDLIAHGAAYRAIQDKLPCMVESIPGDAWAEFLVGLAVVDHASGDPWQDALSTALLVDPDLDRSWLQPELQAFAPMLPSDLGDPFPSDERHFLDGSRVKGLPSLSGIHIAQREYADVWESELIVDQRYPQRWMPEAPTESVATKVKGDKKRPGVPMLVSGLVGAAAFGGATLVTGLSGAQAQREFDPDRYATMRTLNNTSLALTGASAGLVVVGFALK